MKYMILGVCSIAFVGPVAAQEAVTKTGANSAVVAPATHGGGASCAEPCPHKVCVSVPTTKKVSRTVYDSKCIEFCLAKCAFFSRGCNDHCADNCGRVRTKNVLLKKVVTEQCPSTKCEVTLAPPCVTACPPRR